jgi:succinylglutamic semialdehyde dehydrogenase
MNSTLAHAPSDSIGGRFIPIPGGDIVSRDPSQPDRAIWSGSPRAAHVDDAVAAARGAFNSWSALSIDQRAAHLTRWKQVTSKHAERLAAMITDEMGKTLSESLAEAKALGEKVDITLGEHSLRRVTDYHVAVNPTRDGFCRFKPHGVMAVIAPFNFPAHLANGHFVPALLMGNTIVLKPSEKTPGTGQLLAELMYEVGLPPGVFNVVQGGGDIAASLVNHDDIDGILFTGSWPVGRRILAANLDRPGRIIALEMGGNNPAVVLDDAHLKQAVVECVRSAFATTGQRCTCTRRIIVQRGIAERFIPAFCKLASTLLIGPGRSREPVFMGPVATESAANEVIDFQRNLVSSGARILMEATRPDISGYFVTPGVVEVTTFDPDRDREVFGPFAQICVVDDLEQGIAQSNMTQYGLAASIFTASEQRSSEFFRRVKCGCVNWNTGTAGASSKLPFGGVGHSGNHRPAAAFSVDYCAYPIANMVERSPDVAVPTGMRWDDAWT